MPVFKTSGPEDGSETAKSILVALAKCPHARVETPAADADAVRRLANATLAKAARLLTAGARLFDADAARLRANDVLQDATLRNSDELLELAEQHEERAVVLDREAQASALAGGYDDEWPPNERATELVRHAEAALASVREALAGLEAREALAETAQALGRLTLQLEELKESRRLSD